MPYIFHEIASFLVVIFKLEYFSCTGGLLAAELYKSSGQEISISWGNQSSITLSNSKKPVPYVTSNDLIRILENTFNKSLEPLQKVTMNHWLSFSLTLEDDIPKSIQYLDQTLGPITYLVGETLSVSDLAVFSVLHGKYSDKNEREYIYFLPKRNSTHAPEKIQELY